MKNRSDSKALEQPKHLLDAEERKQFERDLDRVLAYGPSKKTDSLGIEVKISKEKIQAMAKRVKKIRETAKKKKANPE